MKQTANHHAAELIRTDINAYLETYLHQDMLRFLTCGSVDDGKSSLIGRLLYDSNQIFEDHMQALKKDSAKVGTTGTEVDLALLVDGLESEREQGITIDVAYRYFTTEKRKFIIADTPGHEQYTRNMATGASTADVAVILVDARKGLLPQTKRHSFIVNQLGIRQVIVAINKMDLVNYDQFTFDRLCEEYKNEIASHLHFSEIHFVPVSALLGDNVVFKSEAMPWYGGSTLMALLESIELVQPEAQAPFRFMVQSVNRPNLDFRGYSGTVSSGSVRVGDALTVLPSGKTSTVKSIVTYDGELESAELGMAVTLTLSDEIDISRGDMLAHTFALPGKSDVLSVKLVWMDEQPMVPGKRYLFKSGTRTTSGEFIRIDHQVDINTYQHLPAEQMPLNGIGQCVLRIDEPWAFDAYRTNKDTGSFIVIDRITNATVGAGMIRVAVDDRSTLMHRPNTDYAEFERELNQLIRKHFPHWHALDITG